MYIFFDYLDAFKQLNERSLPLRELFFDQIIPQKCFIKYFAYVQSVWKRFECKFLLDYMGF